MSDKRTSRSALGWFLQRVSGLFLAFFLIVHLQVMHFSEGSLTLDFQTVTQRLQSSLFWVIYYFLFIPSVVFHGLNGIWGVLADLQPSASARRNILAILWLIGIGLVFFGTWGLIPLFYS